MCLLEKTSSKCCQHLFCLQQGISWVRYTLQSQQVNTVCNGRRNCGFKNSAQCNPFQASSHVQKMGQDTAARPPHKRIFRALSKPLHLLIAHPDIATLWYHKQFSLARAWWRLCTSLHLTKTKKMNRWILYSAPGISGKSALMGQGSYSHFPNVTSSDVIALNTHPSPFLNLPVPVSISHATHSGISYLIKQFANSPFTDSLFLS